MIYEPTLDAEEFNGAAVTHDLDEFKEKCSVILANRVMPEIEDVKAKVYTRDLFLRD